MILSEINRRDFFKRSGLLGAGLGRRADAAAPLAPGRAHQGRRVQSAWRLPEPRLGKPILEEPRQRLNLRLGCNDLHLFQTGPGNR